MIKTPCNKAAGSKATEAYSLEYVAGRHATENAVRGVFIIRLPDPVADNSRHPFLSVFTLAHCDRPGNQA